ncbi:hypothetical protein PSCICJ_29910 [Pseudomonas cichorii]|nr:hypothetical protein PSCICJ_29910 [Pseudomonas cichorii]
MALRRLLGVLPRTPLRNTFTRPSPTSQLAVSGKSLFKKQKQKLFATIVRAPQNATLVKAEWRQ